MDGTSVETVIEARAVNGDRGLGWWSDAWALFTKGALLWAALALILIVCFAALGIVPVLGGLATALLTPVFVGSWMLAARKLEGGGALEMADLFACFGGDHFKPLLVQGALLVAAVVAMSLVAGLLGAGAVLGMMAGGAHKSIGVLAAAIGASSLALLAVLVFGMVISIALWFGPALVVLRNLPPVDALRTSARAVLKNWLPFLVYGLIYIVAAIVASIPLGLGWIVLVPVGLLTMYASYRDVFGS